MTGVSPRGAVIQANKETQRLAFTVINSPLEINSKNPTMDEERSNKVAPPPFNDAHADVILRSSDHVDFQVYRIILTNASQVFRDMFAVPQPTGGRDAGAPIIEMAEDEASLDVMLRCCYPGLAPTITSTAQAAQILRWTDKFGLYGIAERVGREFEEFGEIESKPVEAFALACQYRWRGVAVRAAKASLKLSADELIEQQADAALSAITGKEYQVLFQYHRSCRVVCRDLTRYTAWIPRDINCFDKHAHTTCGDTKKIGSLSFARWWCVYMQEMGHDFMQEGPATVHTMGCHLEAAIRGMGASSCGACKSVKMCLNFVKFAQWLQSEIDVFYRWHYNYPSEIWQ